MAASAAAFRSLVGYSSSYSSSSSSSSSPPVRGGAVKKLRYNPEARRGAKLVCAAVGELSSDSTVFLVAGAVGIAVLGTAFPIFFSRKDLCPECDGAGFVRTSGSKLTANAARKDLQQIVCPNCKGLGKLAQVDK